MLQVVDTIAQSNGLYNRCMPPGAAFGPVQRPACLQLHLRPAHVQASGVPSSAQPTSTRGQAVQAALGHGALSVCWRWQHHSMAGGCARHPVAAQVRDGAPAQGGLPDSAGAHCCGGPRRAAGPAAVCAALCTGSHAAPDAACRAPARAQARPPLGRAAQAWQAPVLGARAGARRAACAGYSCGGPWPGWSCCRPSPCPPTGATPGGRCPRPRRSASSSSPPSRSGTRRSPWWAPALLTAPRWLCCSCRPALAAEQGRLPRMPLPCSQLQPAAWVRPVGSAGRQQSRCCTACHRHVLPEQAPARAGLRAARRA